MANLHVLVQAVLLFVGQSTARVEWMIANPPIIFGKTAALSCVTITPNISSNTQHATLWIGGKYLKTMTTNGGTADSIKYAEIRTRHRSKFESILQIHKFDEMDVNLEYSCSIDGDENRKRLSLASDKFEYHPDKDTTTVLATFRCGYIYVVVKIVKVYPIPTCTIMFNENILSRRLTSNTTVNGIFYMVVERVEHYFDVCSGQLIVTCMVGKTEIPIHKESFNRCTKTKEQSPEYSNSFIISVSEGVLLFAILVIGMGCLAKHGKLKKVLCCSVRWRGEKRPFLRHLAEIVNQLIQRGRGDATNDTGQAERHEMISPS